MRIGVDCHILSGKFQGSRTYLVNLYRSILSQNPGHEFVFVGHWNGQSTFGDAVEYADFESHSRLNRLTFETARVIRRFRLDLYHTTYIAPIILPCRSLVTVHDLLFETHPAFFTRGFTLRSRLLVRRSVNHADQVHTISSFSRDAIKNYYGVNGARVKLVPVGIDLLQYNPLDKEVAINQIASTFGIENYVLTVGRLEPRKNHLGLLRAYHAVKQSGLPIGPLVIVGQRDFGYKPFFRLLSDLRLEHDVRILENVSDEQLPPLYSAARLFVYPSFAEGFGIPVLEAMASGVPTVSSNTSAIPEVVGDAGLLVNPRNHHEIATAMLRLLSEPKLSAHCTDKGVDRAKHWTWDNAASLYLDGLAQLADGAK